MENAVFDLVQNGLTLEGLLLIAQLILVTFALLAIKSWIDKTRAFYAFKKSTLVAIGSRIRVPVNGIVQFEGTIRKADKSRVTLENNQGIVYMRTSDFMNATWTIIPT